MAEPQSSTPREYSIAVSHYSPAPKRVLYAHACKDCGRIRWAKEKHSPVLRCLDCSRAYRKEHVSRSSITCQQCRVIFRVVWRSNQTRRFCSRTCTGNAQKSYVEVICKHCKKPFQLSPSEAHRRNRKVTCCSNACRTGHHRWIECANCHKTFNARHNPDRTYCSRSCYRKSQGETRIETIVRTTFEAAGFVVAPEYQPLRMRPFDLFVPALNLLVEADGDYWHSLPGVKERDARKTTKAIAAGFNIERITESVIMSSEWPAVFAALIKKYPLMLPLR